MVVQETMRGMDLALAHERGYDLVRLHSTRFADYVTALDERAADLRVPGIDWTVGETVAHVASVVLRYTSDTRRADTPAGVGEQNAEDIARLGLDVATAARTITEHVALMDGLAQHVDPERLFPFHAGQQTTLAGGWGNLLGELLAHGDDIARATGVPFGIPSDDLEVLWRFTAPLLQGWLRPEAAAVRDTWLLRFPFGDVGAAFDDGRLRWNIEPPVDPDHVIDVDDAAELALEFPYRRRPAGGPEVATLADRFLPL